MNGSDLVALYFIACALMVIGMAMLSLVAGIAARRIGWTTFATGCFLILCCLADIAFRTYFPS